MNKTVSNKHEKRMFMKSAWEHYLTKEIGIEFKACLYFFCILFFYSVYRLVNGMGTAEILHMAEMIGLTYIIGYIQVYLLSNFDEAEYLGGKELFGILLCTSVYTGASHLCRWFDRNMPAELGFAVYILIVYFCAFLVYKSKRKIDEKLLNSDLKAFQERKKNGEHY